LNLGANLLAGVSGQIEQLALKGAVADAAGLVGNIEAELGRVKLALADVEMQASG
jgi:hypothetical protein